MGEEYPMNPKWASGTRLIEIGACELNEVYETGRSTNYPHILVSSRIQDVMVKWPSFSPLIVTSLSKSLAALSLRKL